MTSLPLFERLTDYHLRKHPIPKTDVIELLIYIKDFLDVSEWARVIKEKNRLEQYPLPPDKFEKYYHEYTDIFTRANKKSRKFWSEFEREIIKKPSATS